MSIRMLAVEVYRAIKEMERIEKEIARLPEGSRDRDRLNLELMKARAHRDQMKAMLDGAKSDD